MSSDSEGGSLRFARHAAWASQIAFDGEGKCFVEVHQLIASSNWAPAERKAWVERLEPLIGVRCRVLPRLLGVGETEAGVYALTPVQMGEGLAAFVARVGPLVPGASFALTLQLLEDLLRLPEQKDWVKWADLNAVMVQQIAGGRLQLAVPCLGGGANSSVGGRVPSSTELVEQVCHLIFVMLVGRETNGEKLDQHPVLTKLPSALRLTLRAALQGGDQGATTLSALRDQVREALFAFVGQQGARSPQKLLANIEGLQPENEVGQMLFGSAPVTGLLGKRFSLVEGQVGSAIFEGLEAIQNRDGERVTIHLLPPQRLTGERIEGTVSMRSWKFNPQDTPNLLQPVCVWERPDWGYLAEKREFGIDLDRLLSVRGVLNPSEVLVLSQQIRDGIAQAKACGVENLYLHPSEIFLKVGKPGVMMQREMDRLMERRIDAWPAFTVKLRTHLTTRRFLLIPEDIPGKTAGSSNADLLVLMIFLLSGENPSGRDDLQLAETLPDALRNLLDRHWQKMVLRGLVCSG